MWTEKHYRSYSNTDETTGFFTRAISVEEANAAGIFSFDPGTDGIQVAVIGIDDNSRITGIVPIVLTNEEMDVYREKSDKWKKLKVEITEVGKSKFPNLEPNQD